MIAEHSLTGKLIFQIEIEKVQSSEFEMNLKKPSMFKDSPFTDVVWSEVEEGQFFGGELSTSHG